MLAKICFRDITGDGIKCILISLLSQSEQNPWKDKLLISLPCHVENFIVI